MSELLHVLDANFKRGSQSLRHFAIHCCVERPNDMVSNKQQYHKLYITHTHTHTHIYIYSLPFIINGGPV